MNQRKKFLIFLLLFTFNFKLLTGLAFGQTMSNDSYIIQMGNLNMSAGKPTGAQYSVSFTAGQTGAGLYSGPNYKVKSGFQYIYPFIGFAFSVSSIEIDFGALSPTNPVTRTNTLTVSNQSAGGYIVTAFENHPLLVPATGQQIPDTTCDSGSCNESLAAAWTNSLTYGFGYRCDPLTATNYCVADFNDNTFYKQFTNDSAAETAETIISSNVSGRNQQSEITYKVNISATQPAGQYSNVITYIATPTF